MFPSVAPLHRIRVAMKAIFELGIGAPALFALYRLGLHTGHFRRMERRLLAEARQLAGAIQLVLPVPSSGALSGALSRQARSALLRQANLVVNGRVRLFGDKTEPLRLTFRKPLRHWSAYELGTAPLPSFKSAGSPPPDIKFVWEPARFGWAFGLGRAFQLTKNEKYAQAFWKHFGRFYRGNPPFLGPHWMNGQEVAIRLLALVWSARVFASARASNARRMTRLMNSIAEHAARIPPTLLYARSQGNNHLVSEATAMYTAGAVLDHRPWRDLGWRWLNRALQRQISTYGEYIQHSTNYHRLMLQSVLWADAVRRARKDSWPPATHQALSRASHWLFSMIDPESGRTPNLGANDGALILPLSSAAFEDYRPTVQAAARAFLRTSLPQGDWDEMAVWLGLPQARHTAESAAYAAEHLRDKVSWAYLRASSFRSRLAHMDQLHLDLWWRGLNLVPDAGTYLYGAPSPWDNPLVSTRVHNTVTIDGRDQMTRGGRFLVLDWAPAYSRHSFVSDTQVPGRILAHHDGYRRMGIRHVRTASLLADGRWQIKDDLVFAKRGLHTVRLHWLLFDGEWHIQQRDHHVRLRIKIPGGWMKLDIVGANFSDAFHCLLVRAGKILHGEGLAQPFEGWRSPTYGRKLPALSLAVEAGAATTCSFTSEFRLPK
jgi:hypothetical protein